VNEFVGSFLLSSLGIATPTPAFVEIGDYNLSDSDPLLEWHTFRLALSR
jgi:hypothetical protein